MLLSGIACCTVAIAGYYSKLLLLLMAVAMLLIFAVMLKRRHSGALIFSTLLVLVMLLQTACTTHDIEKAEALDGESCQAKVAVCEIALRGDDYDRAVVEVVDSTLLPKGTRLSVFTKQAELNAGRFAVMDFKLSAVDSKYRTSSYAEKIYLTAAVSNVMVIENKTDFVLTATDRVKEYIRTSLFSYLGYDEAATLCALLFGERGYFSDEFYDNVNNAGVSHVMVVSGMHLSIFVMLLTYITERFMYNRHFRALLMLLSVLLITALCGFTQSMLRADITYILTAVGLIINRPCTPENTLGGAVAIICIISPFAIFSVALQLSLLSTFGILVVAATVIRLVKEKRIIKSNILFAIFSSVTVTLGAMLLTLPVAIYNFEYVSFVAVITNLLIAPAVTGIIWLSVCGLLAGLVLPFIAEIIFIPCEILTKYVNGVINYFASLPFSVIKTPKFTAFIAAAVIAAIFLIMLACKFRRDVLELEKIREKIIKEGGKSLKWR